MEGTAERTVNIYTNPGKTLAEKINDHLALTKQSIAGLAKDVNYSRTAVSRYLSGKYDSNATGLEEKLAEWYAQSTGDAVKMPEGAKGRTPRRPQFLESRDATAVLGVCQSCQEYIGLGIVVGRSGYGKTHTLKQYAKRPVVMPRVRPSPSRTIFTPQYTPISITFSFSLIAPNRPRASSQI